jgi:hypothetical protein
MVIEGFVGGVMKRRKGRIRGCNCGGRGCGCGFCLGGCCGRWTRRWWYLGLTVAVIYMLINGSPVVDAYLVVNMNSDSVVPSQTAVNLNHIQPGYRSPLRSVNMCVDCDDPAVVGSYIIALEAKYGIKNYDVTGELVYCVPNMADGLLLNGFQFPNRIVMVNRGINTFWEKVSKIQREGASGTVSLCCVLCVFGVTSCTNVGIIIADDGSCGEGDQFSNCGPRVGSVAQGGFAAFDDNTLWATVQIPVVLVSVQTAQRLRDLMKAKLTTVISMGPHFVNEVKEDTDGRNLLTSASRSVYMSSTSSASTNIYSSLGVKNVKEKRNLFGTNIFDSDHNNNKKKKKVARSSSRQEL